MSLTLPRLRHGPRNAYNMVLNKFGQRLYSGLSSTVTAHLDTVAQLIEQAHGAAFLPELKTRWQEHNKSMQMIRCVCPPPFPPRPARSPAPWLPSWLRDIMMYMDRTFVAQNNLLPVHDLGLSLWRERVCRCPPIRQRLVATLLEMVRRERVGESVDRTLVRATTQMLCDLGAGVYVEDFERHFLGASAEFYAHQAQHLLTVCDCPEYLRTAEQRLGEEQERCRAVLDASTEAKLQAVVEQELLGRHLGTLLDMPASGLVAMLTHDRLDDLARLYSLLRRPGVTNGPVALRNGVGAHVRDSGRALVTDPEVAKDPCVFVQRLLEGKDKYDAIVQRSLGGDKTIGNAVNASFENFVNLNPRAPEYLSLFVDDLLRKGLKGASEADSERLLDKAMQLFRFLTEKDVFEKYYKQHLAKRLLGGRTVSDDSERAFIVKLKTECGHQYTNKIEGMFTDMRTSRDTMVQFKHFLEAKRELEAPLGQGGDGGEGDSPAGAPACGTDDSPAGPSSAAGDGVDMGGVELNVQVLTTGSWPMPPGVNCSLPPQLERCCEVFRQFYLEKFTGRRLLWQLNMGSADLRAQFGSSRHELNVNTFQMCILMLFNGADHLAYSDIAEATGIPGGELKRNLQSLALVKGKNVLRKEPQTKEVEDGDVFHFNDKFTSKLHKVKISTVAAQKESEPEKLETRQKVEDDRKPQIEAAIVRIMKARRVLDHNAIVSEVTKQLQNRFMPNPAVIKKRVESLIERDFLERGACRWLAGCPSLHDLTPAHRSPDKTDRRLYRYLA